MSALDKIKFGTDGWRALIAREYTFANLERVSQAYADFLLTEVAPAPFVVVGYDCRFMSENFAARAAEILAGNGCRVAQFSRSHADAADFLGGQRSASERWRRDHRFTQSTRL